MAADGEGSELEEDLMGSGEGKSLMVANVGA